MTKLRFAAGIAIALSATPAAALDIYNDNGGQVFDHARRYERAPKPIRVFGACKSACTLVLAYSNTCAGPDASFTFHAPSNTNGNTAVIARWILGRYRAPIRAWVLRNGGLTSRPITLRGAELFRLVRRC